MLATFYKPTKERHGILTETPTFPSDLFALRSHIKHHGFDPKSSLFEIIPRKGEYILSENDIEESIEKHGHKISLIVINSVNFLTGQSFNIPKIVELAHEKGCFVGVDLAHAIGNIPLKLHDWGVDFGVWCSYKYLNAGPGAVGGAFIHKRHWNNPNILAGWWGNRPSTRFKMQFQPNFTPDQGANAWQISTPSILSLAALDASLKIFKKVNLLDLHKKTQSLRSYFSCFLEKLPKNKIKIITQQEWIQGSQVSLFINKNAKMIIKELKKLDIICDMREPNIIRIALTPLYNTHFEVWKIGKSLKDLFES